jgi:signal transduction histidine kinase
MKPLSNRRKKPYDYRQVFLDFNRTLHTIKDKTLLVSSIATRIYELIPANAIYIFWENSETNRFQLMNTDSGMPSDVYLLPDDGLIQWLKLNETPLTVSFAPEIVNIFSPNDEKIIKDLETALIYSLKTANRFIGAILITKRMDNKSYTGYDLEMLSIMLDNVALAIENVTYHEERVVQLKHIYQTDRLAVIGQLAAGAAHEIRNPLTSIKSAIQYVKDDIQEPRKQKMIQSVLSEVDRINEILTGLLSFSRQNNPVKREFDLAALIDQTLELIRNTRMKKQIKLTATYFAPSMPIVADRDQIKQVLVNIILNAMDAIDDEGEIDVDINPVKIEGEMFYTITVNDNGRGISEESLEKLFDPFYTTKEDGTGLGLSISYGIIHRHKGSIDVCNRTEGGAQVVIRLPKGFHDSTIP